MTKRKRPDSKALALAGLKRAKDTLVNRRNASRLMATVLATATTAAAAAGAAGFIKYDRLATRVQAVEARPQVDVGPLTKTSADLARRVDALRAQAVALAAQIKVMATLPPTQPPKVPFITPTAAASNVAGELAKTASDLAVLSGRVAESATKTNSADAAQAQALSGLASDLATTATDLGTQIDNTAANTQAALAGLTSQAAQLSQTATDLSDLSDKITTVSARVDAEQAALTTVSAKADQGVTAAASAQASADANAAAIADAQTYLPKILAGGGGATVPPGNSIDINLGNLNSLGLPVRYLQTVAGTVTILPVASGQSRISFLLNGVVFANIIGQTGAATVISAKVTLPTQLAPVIARVICPPAPNVTNCTAAGVYASWTRAS